jgi:hypothetical protein
MNILPFSKRKVSLEQINPLSLNQNSPPGSATKRQPPSEKRSRKLTEDEETQNSISLAFNKPVLNGFAKTYLSIFQNGEFMEDSRRKASFSPIYQEEEQYEGALKVFDEIKGN